MNGRRAQLLIGCTGAVVGGGYVAIWGHGLGTIAAAVIMGGALGAARRYPLGACLVSAMALLAIAPYGLCSRCSGVPPAPFPPFLVLVGAHAFSAGRWHQHWPGVIGPIALIAASQIVTLVQHGSAVPFVFVPAAAWAAGTTLREREQVAARLAERAQELEQEREAYARLSVRYERARIASELHDIVAHALSVMVVQAAAGQRLAAIDRELTDEAFDAISGAARQAEQDMGRLVALLGDADGIGPAPDLALVEELVARATGSGLSVTLRLEGEREGLPAAVAQAAYRVVQESLTNALRYASGAAVRVLLRADSQTLRIEVANGPATAPAALAGAGTGNGLRGLRELLAASGGTLDVGPTPDEGWLLTAQLPRSGVQLTTHTPLNPTN
jgi:signal transduction histidine kinase